MSELRELTDAELDIVGGGAKPPPMRNQGGGEIQLIEEVIVDILKLFEPQRQLQDTRRIA